MPDGRGEMAAGIADQRPRGRTGPGVPGPMAVPDGEFEQIQQLTGLVRLAIGRLGGRVSPWLDEGLLMGQGLVTLLELTGDGDVTQVPGKAAVGWVVAGMRGWARASSWFRAAWPCRIAPLCSSLAERASEGAADSRIARDLGLDRERLAERYTEAGLVFGVSPELLLPERAVAEGDRSLSRAISRLPLEQRRLLTLYFEDGLSFPEMAELLRITPEEAQTIFGRAATCIRAAVFGARQLAGGAG